MNNSKLNIEREHNKLNLIGSLDTLTSPQLREILKGLDPETFSLSTPLILDMRNLFYLSSSGLRELLITAKKFGKDKLRLENISQEIVEVLDTTGFLNLFNYTLTPEDKIQGSDILNMSLRELLEYNVRENGNKPAVKSRGVKYTWNDIDSGASAIAAELYALGVRNRTHVALCGFNSLNWILTFYAIQKLGAIAVLLNPQLTANEIASYSHLGDITYFCYGQMPAMKDREKEFLAEVTDHKNSFVRITFDIRDRVNFLDQVQKHFQHGHVRPDDACVMIFTSGSTGKPKGVLLSAYNLLYSARYCVENLHMDEKDIMCAILPMCHIFGLTAALLASAVSGTALILPQSVKADELLHVVDSEKCTILHSVPTVLLRLVNAPGFSTELVSTLRASYLSGAAVSAAQLAMLMEKFPNNHFMRRYGLSEMTPVTATSYDDSPEHTLNTVGKVLEGVEVVIIDRNTGKKLPRGETGEVLVRGHNMMCGYYKLPAEKQPFDSEAFLHTGDLGFLDDDNYLHFAGRAKELIIRGGENIMPDEVAAAISAHESIAEVKVLGVPDEIYGEAVAAVVVIRSGYVFDEGAMREFLSGRLAKYKIPGRFFVYDSLPTLSNGKIDAVSLKKEIVKKLLEAPEKK